MELNFADMDRVPAGELAYVSTITDQMLERRPDGKLCYLNAGAKLLDARGRLESYGVYGKYLASLRGQMTCRTAYRYLTDYEDAARLLPPTVMKEAMARNVAFSKIKDMVKAAPPMPEITKAQAREYLDKILAGVKRKPMTLLTRPEDILAECVRFVVNRMAKLPSNEKLRQKFAEKLARQAFMVSTRPDLAKPDRASIQQVAQQRRWNRVRENA